MKDIHGLMIGEETPKNLIQIDGPETPLVVTVFVLPVFSLLLLFK